MMLLADRLEPEFAGLAAGAGAVATGAGAVVSISFTYF